jgi:hypothetical protein
MHEVSALLPTAGTLAASVSAWLLVRRAERGRDPVDAGPSSDENRPEGEERSEVATGAA